MFTATRNFIARFLGQLWRNHFAKTNVSALPKKTTSIMPSNKPAESYETQQQLTHGGIVYKVVSTILEKEDWGRYHAILHFLNHEIGQELIEDPASFKDHKVKCLLEGSIVLATLDIASKHTFSGELGIMIHFICQEVIACESAPGDRWEFLLPYVDIGVADYSTTVTLPNGRFSGKMDTVRFSINNKEWHLSKLTEINDLHLTTHDAALYRLRENISDSAAKDSPHSVLSIPCSEINQPEAEQIALDICWLLSLALAQRVAWGFFRFSSG
jgi:hypothetical protein